MRLHFTVPGPYRPGPPPGASVSITVDVHAGDLPSDIDYAADWLAARRIPATFFAVSTLFRSREHGPSLRRLPGLGHEVASHTHLHDVEEITALQYGDRRDLGFLRYSKTLFEEFFSKAPVSFRSPCWIRLGENALDELEDLGYRVDSSSTPQRCSLLSSRPYSVGWTFAPRGPYLIRSTLLEIPTSTLLLPAGSPTFLTFRRRASLLLLSLLLQEVRIRPDRFIVLQFHADDFNPNSPQALNDGRLRPEHFLLRANGGFGFKHFLKDSDRTRISGTTEALIGHLAGARFRTLEALAGVDVSAEEEALERRYEPPQRR